MVVSVDVPKYLNLYRDKVESALRDYLPTMGEPSPVLDACSYALLNGGKRFRPSIVFMVADALQKGSDPWPAALAIELFHTASLVVDDLPCMDDDDVRRDKPSLHKTYNEAMSLLVSYALIAAGYDCIAKNSKGFGAEASRMALENAATNTGLLGATGGQFLDLFPPDQSLETFQLIIKRKTVSLFELAFVLGWVFGGGDIHKIEEVKRAAGHYGMAFQLVDDLEDFEQDTVNGNVNLACTFGESFTLSLFHVELEGYEKSLVNLGVNTDPLRALSEFLRKRCNQLHDTKTLSPS